MNDQARPRPPALYGNSENVQHVRRRLPPSQAPRNDSTRKQVQKRDQIQISVMNGPDIRDVRCPYLVEPTDLEAADQVDDQQLLFLIQPRLLLRKGLRHDAAQPQPVHGARYGRHRYVDPLVFP